MHCMNRSQTKSGGGAFTLVEMLVVIAIIGILAALLLPVLNQAKDRAKRVQCVNNLKETGVAFYLFAHDHQGKFTTQVSTNGGGSLEYVAAGYQATTRYFFAFQNVRPLASEIVTPKPFACPADLERWPATNFSDFSDWNLSYDIGLKADPSSPGAVLAGDRDFPACLLPGHYEIHYIPCPPPWKHWGLILHQRKGNMLFLDGHAEESYDALVPAEETVTQNLMYPDVEGTTLANGLLGPSPGPTLSPGEPGPQISYPRIPPTSSWPSSTDRTPAGVRPSDASPQTRGQATKKFLSVGAQLNFPKQTTPGQLAEPQTLPTDAPRIMPRMTVIASAVAMTNEPSYPHQLAQAARESLDATQWLLWLFLLLLLLTLLARWLDRRWQQRKIKKRFNR
jgi:prepilin-type N-terminal cleavage/methylation domain-containing protein/prepilin-type processing-associated H-X9-DG protein